MQSREIVLTSDDTEPGAANPQLPGEGARVDAETPAEGHEPAAASGNETANTKARPPKPEPPNEVDGVNTDGRWRHDWPSKYKEEARKFIRADAWYVAVLLVLALVSIFLTWRGTTYHWLTYGCESCSSVVFKKFSYFFLGGFLGGVLFAMKYLYKVVARGYWNMDRRLWRLFSPFLSGGLALVVGALIDSGVLGLTTKIASGSAFLSYGFITGYFADRAIDKMQEVAETVFGAPGRKDPVKVAAKEPKAGGDAS
jgi:hypothetical protein